MLVLSVNDLYNYFVTNNLILPEENLLSYHYEPQMKVRKLLENVEILLRHDDNNQPVKKMLTVMTEHGNKATRNLANAMSNEIASINTTCINGNYSGMYIIIIFLNSIVEHH